MNYRLRTFITTIVLFGLLFSSVYGVKASSIADENGVPLQQKGLSVLSDVVNLDMPNYAVSSTVYNSSDKNLVSQENVGYYLTYIQSVPPSTGQASNGSLTSQPNSSEILLQECRLNVLCAFTNGALQTLYVREKIGIPILSNSEVDTTTTGLAATFLSNYQSFTNEALYGILGSTLADIDGRKNCTQIIDDVRFEVIVANDETLFKWTAYPDGIIAPSKFVALCFKDGFLAYFNDNWQFHKVGSTNVVLSEDQASEIALQSANEFYSNLNSNTTKVQTNYFNKSNVCLTALLLDGSTDDALTLYPVWRIGIAFNEWYGNIYGVQVDIWADTGQIRSVTGQYSSLTPKTTSAISDMSPALSNVQDSPVNQYPVSEGGISIALGGFIEYLLLFMSITLVAFILVKKPKLRSSLSSFKSPSLRIHSLVLATLILSLVLLPIMTASASPSNAAVIWGSESTGQFNGYSQPYTQDAYWRKSYNETIAQGVASDFIHQQFVDTDVYASVNHQGADSYKNQVLGDIYSTSGYLSLASNYARLAVVYFDHGVGLSSGTGYTDGIFHYMVEDNEGTVIGPYGSTSPRPSNGIYDADIYTRTSATAQNSITFSFINTCLSASYNNAYNELDNDPYYTSYGITQGILPDSSCRSLPYAFTHRQVATNGPGFNVVSQISADGYDNPDDGSQVYIGFPKGSAALSQIIPFNDNELFYGAPYWAWVDRFFATAVTLGNSVNNALDIASIQTWGSSFGNSPLKTGFTPFWPINGQNGNWPPTCTMAVYGNGLIVLDSFSNNFDDYNYNDWTVSSGSWSAASGQLTNSPGTSLIATDALFTTDRHVRVTVRATQSGADSWDVPWVVAKLGNGGVSYNSVYGLIHTNGLVELACFYNGQKTMWTTPSNLSPFNEHVIDIDTVGNTAYMYVDGTLYLTETNACFGALWGKTALMASGNSAGVFNKVSVLKQSYANNQWSDSLRGSSIDTNLWAPIQSNGGSVWENGNLYVNAPSGYTGWSQAGVITQNSYVMTYTCVSVNVADFNALDEMHIQIGNSKITSSDPINDPNFYRVGKLRDQSDTVIIQRKVNGALTTLYSHDWHGATGKLSILVYGGVISFFENDVWLYSENFALPSSSCYISCYTSSSTRPATDAFNNFEYIST